MRLLLDECIPRPLKRDIEEHDVRHVTEMGWSGKENGELLRLMVAEGFAAFVTVDQNLAFQQNVVESGLAVLVLVATPTGERNFALSCRRCSRRSRKCGRAR